MKSCSNMHFIFIISIGKTDNLVPLFYWQNLRFSPVVSNVSVYICSELVCFHSQHTSKYVVAKLQV